MNGNLHGLQNILDMNKWQKLQDALASVAGMAIIVTDYKGIPVTRHSSCNVFCHLLRQDEKLSKLCYQCDSHGGLEAIRQNKPYIYLCHNRILDAAIPIIVDNTYVGAVMIGQVLLSSENEMEELEQIYQFPGLKQPLWEDEHYKKYYKLLPSMSLSRVKMIIEMLFHLCNYIIEEAIEKNLIMTWNMNANTNGISLQDIVAAPNYTVKSIERIKKRIDATLTNQYLSDGDKPPTDNIILQPAFEYVSQHKHEKCTVNDMARICHISPSYFSKLFLKETGECFSVYHARVKIEWAKQLLENSEKTINEIGEDLGFSDAGYFIKTFKRFETITPMHYRRLLRQVKSNR